MGYDEWSSKRFTAELAKSRLINALRKKYVGTTPKRVIRGAIPWIEFVPSLLDRSARAEEYGESAS